MYVTERATKNHMTPILKKLNCGGQNSIGDQRDATSHHLISCLNAGNEFNNDFP